MKRSVGDSQAASVLVLALIVQPSLYVLSVGPAVRLREMGAVTESDLERVYFPLVWLDRNMPPFRRVLDWYTELWV